MNTPFIHHRTLVPGFCLALVIGIQSGETSFAQVTGQADRDGLPTAESILERHIEATGGRQAQLELRSMVMSGRWANDLGGHKFETDITVTAVAPNKRHVVLQHPQFNMVRVTNGQEAWEWRPNDRQHSHSDGSTHTDSDETKLLDEPEKSRTIEEAVFNSHVDWQGKFQSVTTVCVAEVKDKPAYEIQVTTHNGEQYQQFYDKETGRLVKTTRIIKSSLLGEYELESVIERYQEFDGIWLATKIRHVLRTDSMGEGTQNYDYSNVELNSDVPDTLFEVPASLKTEGPDDE